MSGRPPDVLIVTADGYAKGVLVEEVRETSRGGALGDNPTRRYESVVSPRRRSISALAVTV
jgi:hypothetical protein